jgi:hypothetical protein
VILLKGQTTAEEKKERAVKIFEGKLNVYSEFMRHLWGMFNNKEDESSEITSEELKQLRNICFQQLVFYLNDKEIEGITEQLQKIADKKAPVDAASQIPFTLKKTLKLVDDKTDETARKDNEKHLKALFNAFRLQKGRSEGAIPVSNSVAGQSAGQHSDDVENQRHTNYWHFAMNDEEQIKQLESGNNVLALFEYGESWRTEQVLQVQPGDVVFLVKKGGSGYIGAFKAEGSEVVACEKFDSYTDDYIERFDMYKRVSEDVADYAANIVVKTLAFNYNGVGYKSVRRKTIERINDTEAVKYLLTRFSGKDLSEEQKAGMNKFAPDKQVAIEPVDRMFFQKLVDDTIKLVPKEPA